ncbi:MAG: LacI family DNA-binding transcriptional regulator [Motiliproteus sp.]
MENSRSTPSRRSSGRVTLAEVAERAGVSAITVSRALKHPDRVSNKLRAKITLAVQELGYIPNQAARSLASAESKIISVIFPSLSNAVFSDLLDGIHDSLVPAGYRILLANSHYSITQEDELVETMLEQNPDGIIITGIDQSPKTKKRLQNINIPIVQVMELTDNPLDMSVGISHFDAGHAITEHLFGKGYKKIGFIGARMDERAQRRMQGYRQSMIAHDQDPDRYILTSLANTSFQRGADMMTELISKHNEIDALFLSNDDLAAGAIFECQRRGIQVPQQLAIAGFNDLEFSKAINPALTTVAIPRFEMGKQAAQCLLDRIEDKPFSKSVDVGFSILDRESTR